VQRLATSRQLLLWLISPSRSHRLRQREIDQVRPAARCKAPPREAFEFTMSDSSDDRPRTSTVRVQVTVAPHERGVRYRADSGE
jgi:hypothetical protein